MIKVDEISSFDGTKLFIRKDVPQGSSAIVLLIHGLCEHLGRYDYVAAKLNDAGLGVYRFDHRGHGRSEGECAYYKDYNDMVDDANVIAELAMKENPGKPLFVMGHSMGGFCSLLFGAKYPGKAAGIVLSGALSHDVNAMMSGVKKGQDPLTRLPNDMPEITCSVKAIVDAIGRDELIRKYYTVGLCYALDNGINWLKTKYPEFNTPILIMHGGGDKIVNVKDSCLLFEEIASGDKQLKIFGNLYHEILNEYCRDEVIGDAVFWILRRVK